MEALVEYELCHLSLSRLIPRIMLLSYLGYHGICSYTDTTIIVYIISK